MEQKINLSNLLCGYFITNMFGIAKLLSVHNVYCISNHINKSIFLNSRDRGTHNDIYNNRFCPSSKFSKRAYLVVLVTF